MYYLYQMVETMTFFCHVLTLFVAFSVTLNQGNYGKNDDDNDVLIVLEGIYAENDVDNNVLIVLHGLMNGCYIKILYHEVNL